MHLQTVCLDSGIAVVPSSLASSAIQQFFFVWQKADNILKFYRTSANIPKCFKSINLHLTHCSKFFFQTNIFQKFPQFPSYSKQIQDKKPTPMGH